MGTTAVLDRYADYPIHEEESVPQGPPHAEQAVYFKDVVQAHRPDLWVLYDACVYWVEGDPRRYIAPDISVGPGPPPDRMPPVYLFWERGPLHFVAEVASPSNTLAEMEAKRRRYEGELRVPECLFCDPARPGDSAALRLWRLVEGVYREVVRNEDGRLWSESLDLWFGYDDQGFVRVYTPAGEMLLTYREQRELTEAERQRADGAERRMAELEAELERFRARVNGTRNGGEADGE